MGRPLYCEKVGLKKTAWTAEEDEKLTKFIMRNGQCCWRAVPKLAGLSRGGKSCRLRWVNYLRPDLKRGLLSQSEEQQVIDLHAKFGSKWSKIADHLPGRTDNGIKNYWNTHIKKKLRKMGIDPLTHKPISTAHDHQQQPQQHYPTCHVTSFGDANDEERKSTKSAIGSTETNSKVNLFCTEEVPLIQSQETVVPYVLEEYHFPFVEWPEFSPMHLWRMEDFKDWDMICDDGDGQLAFDPLNQYQYQELWGLWLP